MRETFTVRKQSFGVGVERTFPVHSPKIERIEVAARGDVRRAKLYYLRGRVGKRARVRERRYTGPEEIVQAGLLHDPAAEVAAAVDDEVPGDAVDEQALAEAEQADEQAPADAGEQPDAAAAARSRLRPPRSPSPMRLRSPTTPSSVKKKSSASSSLLELIMIVAVALGLALGIQAFLVKPYRIPSPSMVPTLVEGQRILVNRIGNRFGDPSVGDIVVFHPPAGAENGDTCGSQPGPGQACDEPTPERADTNFVKRVVAGPGDRIAIVDGHVILNGERQEEPFIRECGPGSDCDFPRRGHRSRRSLLHDGRQPWGFRRQPFLGTRAARVDHRRRLRHLLAAKAHRPPLTLR